VRHDFPVEGSSEIYAGRVMALRSDRVVMPGGRVATREIVEHPGAVAVVALDADDRVMMIHQYRHAVRRRLWELPAGLLDVAGEDPVLTAQRELAEESGLAATEWSVLIDVVPSPGFSDESVRVYLARGISEVGRPAPDGPDEGDNEEADLTVKWVSMPVAVRMVLAGTIVNAVTVAAVLAAHVLAGAPTAARPPDAPWQDRPSRFAARGD
jgi:8-oxo-dGTP pyrophosphatase MutT (NUDIX family)